MCLGKNPHNKGSKSDKSNHRLWKAHRFPQMTSTDLEYQVRDLFIPFSLPKSFHCKDKYRMCLNYQSLYGLLCSSVSLNSDFQRIFKLKITVIARICTYH